MTMNDENSTTDDYFGLCPRCRRNNGYFNAGRNHWFYCDEHRTKWWGGSNVFSSWRHETEGDQRAHYDAKGFGTYERVAPYYHPLSEDEIERRKAEEKAEQEERERRRATGEVDNNLPF
jgi:hypothetical protein